MHSFDWVEQKAKVKGNLKTD